MKRVLTMFGAGLLLLGAVLVAKTAGFQSRQIQAAPGPPLALTAEVEAAHLARAVTWPTISSQFGTGSAAAFAGLYRQLEAAFPHAFAALEATSFSEHARMFFWRGRSGDPAMLLAAHVDVVPAAPDGLTQWTVPPFAGMVRDGYIWGRGTLDDKGNAVAILSAIDRLVRDGYTPRRGLVVALGHDEEIGGRDGAAVMADYLATNKIELYAALDEGLAVTHGLTPGIKQPVAMVGIAERGYATVRLTASAPGGHSSMPPKKTAVGQLSRALTRLGERPFPARLSPPVRQFFEWVGPHMPWPQRLVMANLWLTEPLLMHLLAGAPGTNALVRTTVAPTMLDAGVKENVLPTRAEAVVNLRLAPGDTTAQAIATLRSHVAEFGVRVEPLGAFQHDPTAIAPVDTAPFRQLQTSIMQIFPDAVVAPNLVVGATDARYYTRVTANVFRFSPMPVAASDLARIHGIDERISVDAYLDMIRFYHRLIVNTTG